LWQISPRGWMPEAAILRRMTISGQEILAAALAERLR
jgi:hypothetical protein